MAECSLLEIFLNVRHGSLTMLSIYRLDKWLRSLRRLLSSAFDKVYPALPLMFRLPSSEATDDYSNGNTV